jgi:hypothetical protein
MLSVVTRWGAVLTVVTEQHPLPPEFRSPIDDSSRACCLLFKGNTKPVDRVSHGFMGRCRFAGRVQATLRRRGSNDARYGETPVFIERKFVMEHVETTPPVPTGSSAQANFKSDPPIEPTNTDTSRHASTERSS